MPDVKRAFFLGGGEGWSGVLQDALAVDVGRALPVDEGPGDLFVLDAATPAGAAAMPAGNAFSTCRALKRNPAVLVFIIVRESDPFGAEIARYCLADGVLVAREDGELSGLDRIEERIAPRRGPPPIDSLLQKLEGDLGEHEARASSGLQRILAEAGAPSSTARWTDAETGLFDGPFAGFKLDEEFKRAMRFHQPLSMVLLDAGVETWPSEPADRRAVLAEIASTFLNESRDIDVLARFTETVFMFLFPGTGPEGAAFAARRMVDSLSSREYSAAVEVRPVAGIATIPHTSIRDSRGFLARAEAALERGRSGGEDRVNSAPL